MVYSSTGRSRSPLPSGVSTVWTNFIVSTDTPLATSSPGLTICPSPSKRSSALLSLIRRRSPPRTIISRRISFFWVTVTTPAVWLKISLTTSVPASIHWPSVIINKEISLLISWVSCGTHSKVPPLLTSYPFLAERAFLIAKPGANLTRPPVPVRKRSSASSAITSPLPILLPGMVFKR